LSSHGIQNFYLTVFSPVSAKWRVEQEPQGEVGRRKENMQRKEANPMAVIRWQAGPNELSESSSDLDRLRQGMEWLLDSFSSASPGFSSRVFPAINITEDRDYYYLRAELPGVKSEDLDISVVENQVSIAGERKIPVERKEFGYHRREREDGSFRRTISLSMDVDADKVSAEMKKGILKVTLPKHERAKPRKVQISATK
jgi:HSP20 family protein